MIGYIRGVCPKRKQYRMQRSRDFKGDNYGLLTRN